MGGEEESEDRNKSIPILIRWGWGQRAGLREDLFDDFSVDVGKAELPSLESVGELLMVES